MLTRYPELQSGFVGYPGERLLLRPEPAPSTPVSMTTQPKMARTQQDYFFSGEVEQLCQVALNNPFKLSEIEFQGEVFQVCGALFDRKGIFQWMRIQEQGRHVSHMHRLFLEDTLGAVLLDKPRMHEPQQWSPMLSTANDPSVKPFKAAAVTERIGVRPPDDLPTFLNMWVQNKGMGDLIFSLQTIFGRRTLHASQGAAKY